MSYYSLPKKNNRLLFCLNFFDRDHKLQENIQRINRMFNYPPIFVASNGLQQLNFIPSENVRFRYWGENQGWQLGAFNSCIASLRFACDILGEEIQKYNVVFCHDDVYPVNAERIDSLLNLIPTYDGIFRECMPKTVENNIPFTMIESFILSGKAVRNFQKLPVYTYDIKCAEVEFSKLLVLFGLNVKCIPFQDNPDFTENEMGFMHDHRHTEFYQIFPDVGYTGWEISPKALLTLQEILLRSNPSKLDVLEFGSGKSTEVISLYKHKNNIPGVIDSFDADPQYAHPLAKIMKLKSYDGRSIQFGNDYAFYDLNDSDFSSSKYNLVIIDGHHGHGRSVAFDYMKGRLDRYCIVVIDDYDHYPFESDFLSRFPNSRLLIRNTEPNERYLIYEVI